MAKGDKFVLVFLFLLALGLFGGNEACAAELADSSSDAAYTDHGDIQVFKLVNDRPQLQPIVQNGNPIWNWLRNGFDYSDGGIKIFWDSGPTKGINAAETATDQSSKWCFIRADGFYKGGATAGAEIKAEELLANIVLELNNARQRNDTATIWRKASKGKLTKKEYIIANAKLEFRSEKGVKSFLVKTWLPFCKEHQIESDPQVWNTCQFDFFSTWMKHYPPGSVYPWKVYGDEYDAIVKTRSTHL